MGILSPAREMMGFWDSPLEIIGLESHFSPTELLCLLHLKDVSPLFVRLGELLVNNPMFCLLKQRSKLFIVCPFHYSDHRWGCLLRMNRHVVGCNGVCCSRCTATGVLVWGALPIVSSIGNTRLKYSRPHVKVSLCVWVIAGESSRNRLKRVHAP